MGRNHCRIAIGHHRAAALVAARRRQTGEGRSRGPEGRNGQHQNRAFSPHGHSLAELRLSIFQGVILCRDLDHRDTLPKLGANVKSSQTDHALIEGRLSTEKLISKEKRRRVQE